MISAVISLSHPRSLWLPKCAMKWIEAKRKLMPPSLSRVFSLRGCWWRGTPPTASITKLDSAESALTRAAVLSQMQRETCKRLFHTCFTTRLLYISIQLRWWEIFTRSFITTFHTYTDKRNPLSGVARQDNNLPGNNPTMIDINIL